MSSTFIEELWGIILTGGDGISLQNYLLKEFDFTKPKQFCNIIGTRSLYKHTLDRIFTLDILRFHNTKNILVGS